MNDKVKDTAKVRVLAEIRTKFRAAKVGSGKKVTKLNTSRINFARACSPL